VFSVHEGEIDMQQPRIITALITPFLNGEVDIEGLKINIAHQLENGVEGILVLGTTGESPTLTKDERKTVIATTVKAVGKRLPVFVGTGTNATQSTIELTNEAYELGADVAVVVTPYYNCPMQKGIYEHFAAVCHATNIPICIYNIPKRTGSNITVETLILIANLPRIIGVKESSGDLNQSATIINEVSSKHENFMVWSGDDALTLPMISLGGTGIISVASNIVPREMSIMVNAASTGDFKKARQIFFTLLPLLNVLFIETNPIPLKAAMEMCGMPSGPCRLPLGNLSSENREILRNIVNKRGKNQLAIRNG